VSIIDRILNGEFDEDNDSVRADNCLVPGDYEEEFTDEGDEYSDDESDSAYDPDEELDDLPDEDDEDLEDSTDLDRDVPSDDFCEDYMKENNSNAELVMNSPKSSTIKPKETNQMNPKNVKNVNPSNNPAPEAPKNTSAPAPAPATPSGEKRGRGRPHKLAAQSADVVKLYSEGVGAKTIAEKFGVSVSCVINCLKANNIEIRPKGRRKSA